MKKIKIGLFLDTFYPLVDGVVVTLDNYAKRLVKYADVVVVVPSFGKEDKKYKFNYKVIRVKSVRLKTFGYNLAVPDAILLNKLKKENFDIIHIHSPFIIGRLGVTLAKRENIPVVATMHSQFKRDFKRYVKSENIASFMTKNLMRVFNKCNECWALSSSMADLYHDYGYKHTPYIMRNATDMMPIANPLKALDLVNNKYNLKSDEIVLLFVGRMNLQKNLLFLVDSLKCLNDLKFNYKMLFVGTGIDFDKVESRVKEYNLNDKVMFLKEVDDRNLLSSIYLRANLFVFPSLYDASSLVQIEAASQKTPTIFIENAITASNIKDNVNGYIGKNDPMLFAKKIKKIFENNDKYKKVCDKAFIDLYQNYDDITLKVYDRYLEIIDNYKDK